MKKLFIFIALMSVWISSTFADWSLSTGETIIIMDPVNTTLLTCTTSPASEGNLLSVLAITMPAELDTLCWPNPVVVEEFNPITTLANTTWNGGITEAGNIMAWPIGYIIYFSLGLSLLGIVIFAIKSFTWGGKKTIKIKINNNFKRRKKGIKKFK